ncbi:EAL domain-containing protein [Acetobacterium sp.]|uniref:EAL domain-containing protein n=1 Tax=Acetobacterium sp. TaxID=1872094 RepID=UPI000CA7EF61|nr:EAL domain-containing protein [Acetobacterium sp.]MDO9492677.1 EAL domain-containing protein [Acetobacterium sp.]PKM74255.1 MAG: bifunctional diguanylate cyclase/phosphodiesterase [Firmicutes bacterium HGW-Firmicutes-17]
MDNRVFLLSIVFFIFFIFYTIAGLYVFFKSPKKPINRVLLAALVSLSLWTFGFTIAISAVDYETCLFWRRFSALGWGSFFAVLLHFSLMLAEKKDLLKRWWVYILLYLPAGIVVFAFAISNNLAPTLFNLVETEWGWINQAQNTVWDLFYSSYYIGYSLASMVMIWRWGLQHEEPQIKKQSRIIIGFYFLAFLLGTLTDIISNTYLGIAIPQMAPIFLLLPVFSMFYTKNYFGVISARPEKLGSRNLNIISTKKVYIYLSMAMIFGGVLNFVTQYLVSKESSLGEVLVMSGILISFGLMIQLVQRLKQSDHLKDYLSVSLLAVLIPIVTLEFAKFGAVTIWAFPFILIIAFLVFKEKILLGIMTVSIISTQIIVWVMVPLTYVKVSGVDYSVRIGLFCIAIWLCYYINKLFLVRLDETAEKMELQELITQISSDCVGINQQNFTENIDYLLKKSCEFFFVDRAYICLFDPEHENFSCLQDYCQPGIKSGKERIQNLPIDGSHWRMEKILGNEIFVASDLSKLPDFVNAELFNMEINLIKSQIIAPIASKEKIIGFWGFDTETKVLEWQDDHLNFAKIIANILGDTISRIDSEKELSYRAHYDEITKLPNRNLFTNYLYFSIVKQEFTDTHLGIIFLDLDSFKTVNNTVGHEMGDELLYLVGEKIKRVVDKTDLVSRFSGDEFLIMVSHIKNKDEMAVIAEKLMSIFDEPFILRGQEFFMTASAGIALYPIDGKDPETLIMNADIAKYKAKEKGRNQYLLCSSDMKEEVNRQNQLTSFLYRALEKNELFINYQPQVCLNTGKVTGVESLLRWQHPELGLISPAVIIPLAEKTSLINPIGEWVLETACRQNKAWQDMGMEPILMAVNISASQFKNPNLISQVEGILKKTGLKPEYLEVEITESTAILELNEIICKLNGLKEIGVSLAIDDFGTEYSSLGRLKMLPLDRLKMDKQFVDGIGSDHKDQAIAKAIIQLGKSLGLSVVAEGVEDENQVSFLKTAQCDLIQGYYYYKPLDAAAIAKILKQQS